MNTELLSKALELVEALAALRTTGDVIRDDGEVYTYAMDDDSGENLDQLDAMIRKARGIVGNPHAEG
jgi:hypothetical protein